MKLVSVFEILNLHNPFFLLDIPLGDISEEAESILNIYRREALEEIQLYYRKELCLSDFSTRMGNLMSANHAVQVIFQ